MLRHHTQKQKIFLYLSAVLILPMMLGVFCDANALTKLDCTGPECETGVTFRALVNEVLTVSITEPESMAMGGLTNQTGNRRYSDLLRNRYGVTINSNNAAGFSVLMNTASESGALENTHQSLSTDSIPMLESNWTREDTLRTKFWGYSMNDDEETGTYRAFAKSGQTPTEIFSSDSAAISTFNLYFGAMADDSITSGTYAATVVINVVTAVATDDEILYMQDVAEWGDSLETLQEIVVRDARDEKEYTVRKMPDGHIWMTQNLDHDIDMSYSYGPTNTDIPSSWSPSASTRSTNDTTWNNSKIIESYNPGDLYWTGATQDGSQNVNNYISETGDSHYKLGNYYNFAAALAVNDVTSYIVYNSVIDRSICPAGWTLPRTGTGDDTFYALLEPFGYASSAIGTSNAWSSPFYFGLTGVWTGELRFVGNRGIFSSGVVGDVTDSAADYTLFYNGQTNMIDSVKAIGGGQTLRCFTRPATTTLSFD